MELVTGENGSFLLFFGLLEEEDSLLFNQKLQEFALFFLEHEWLIIFWIDQPKQLFFVLALGVIFAGSIHNHAHSVLDILEGSESFVQVSHKFGQFICSHLWNVALVHN